MMLGARCAKSWLRSSGTAPEDLALEGDIRQVRKQIRTANREMKKLDTPPKKKR